MNDKICLECGLNVIGKTKNCLNRQFINHLVLNHAMTHEQYVVKHEFDGKHPKCHCGCDNDVKFTKGRFLKYFSDHKNHMKLTEEQKKKLSETNRIKNGVYRRLESVELTEFQLRSAYDSFLANEKSLRDLATLLVLDKRTIKRFWKELGFIEDMAKFERIAKKSQGMWKYKIIQPSLDDIKELERQWTAIVYFLSNSAQKRTITEVIRVFNLKVGYNYLFDLICKRCGLDFVKEYLHLCNQSKIEIEFYNILKFYFGNSIKKQFLLNGKSYDYCLGGRILIELDGIYWHSKPKAIMNDKEKDEIAKSNGFTLLRVSEKEVKNINILFKIKELYEKIQID